jgi:hypothetical protein
MLREKDPGTGCPRCEGHRSSTITRDGTGTQGRTQSTRCDDCGEERGYEVGSTERG